MNPDFEVPAEYFYALGSSLPGGVSAADRYVLATASSELALATALQQAVNAGTITPPAGMTPLQAARRLAALGAARAQAQSSSEALYTVTPGPADTLINAWLGAADPANWPALPDPDAAVWPVLLAAAGAPQGQLVLVACALTGFNDPTLSAFVTDIGKPLAGGGLGVTDADELAAVTSAEWTAFLTANPQYLPAFTQPPGTSVSVADRIAAFLQFLKRFYAVPTSTPLVTPPAAGDLPLIDRYGFDPLLEFLTAYDAANPPYTFGTTPPDDAAAKAGAASVFPTDPEAQAWLLQALATINDLVTVTAGLATGPNAASLEFSIIEALYARGFDSKGAITVLDEPDFVQALTGSVAWQWGAQIWANAGGTATVPPPPGSGFKPVNGGSLRDCLPPPELSPFGPVAYLQDLLRAGPDSTCDQPDATATFGSLLAPRRGDLAALAVTRANLETPLPVIDLVNECLEHLAAQVTASAGGSVSGVGGAVYDTASDALGDHLLRPPGTPPEPGLPYHHDPASVFDALAEHSAPASPVAEPGAYAALAADYSAPDLPYAEALDVSRSYLCALDTTRFETMRRFRAQITEFVLGSGPASDPAGFDSTVWRYPVHTDIAPEYLQIAAAEYKQLFATPVATSAPAPAVQLGAWQLYGFAGPTIPGGLPWTDVAVRVVEFLARTGLSYCELVELSVCGFLPFGVDVLQRGNPLANRDRANGNGNGDGAPEPLPACEPCDLDALVIAFGAGGPAVDPAEALMQLAVFIRLWRRLRQSGCEGYSFVALADICAVLGLFAGGTINPRFIPELAAFQILRDDLCLPLGDSTPPSGVTGVERTPLLALWAGASGPAWDWALAQLLDAVRRHALRHHGAADRGPDYLKVLAGELDELSTLMGFVPATPEQTWHAAPTHTLRFAEVLVKLYASDFTVGEVEFLFTVLPHLDGDDPFPLGDDNEALDDPLGLPDDDRHDLWSLRHELLEVEVDDDELRAWHWPRINAWLRDELGYDPGAGPDRLTSLAEHAFPGMVERSGHAVPAAGRRYEVSLAAGSTTPGMWNTDPDSPISYDAGRLQATLPLSDHSVLEVLGRVRQLSPPEAAALRELYWAPRADLAPFLFLFTDPVEADRRLLQEGDEQDRWRFFQRQVVLTHARCRVIARHLACAAGDGDEEAIRRAWLILRSLYADEDPALTPWESAQPSGAAPQVAYPQPTGGAFASLLGLCGTGLRVDYALPGGGSPLWSEASGALELFGEVRNRLRCPLPTMLPPLAAAPAPSSLVELRNGFAFSDRDDRNLGGASGFAATTTGVLLVERPGRYRFAAGAPAEAGERPSVERAEHEHWQIRLRRGQREFVLLSHRWPGQPDTAHEVEIELRHGAYDIGVELEERAPAFTEPDDVHPRHAGLQVRYAGPDTGDDLVTIPHRRLFRAVGERPRRSDNDEALGPVAAGVLESRYQTSLRDIRRTWQRAFKATLLATRFGLSARPAEDGGSELGFLLAHPDRFAGTCFYGPAGGPFTEHAAQLDLNFLPVGDPYHPPAGDDRANPSVPRQAALFDWWERLFDYVALRREDARAREAAGRRGRPRLWRLFAAAAGDNPTDIVTLAPHLEVPLDLNDLVQRFSGLQALLGEQQLTAENLQDERWAIRAWKALELLRRARRATYTTRLTEARPDLWAADDPSAGSPSGNDNLTAFVADALIEMGEPRRYRDLETIDDGLRRRARRALVAYLIRLDRVQLPGPPVAYATSARDLSDLLLIDVDAGLGEEASRIDDAVTTVQAFVSRALLGLEPGVTVGPPFRAVWEGRFKDFRTWQACKRRETYPENVAECEAFDRARRHEAFRLLETELLQDVLSTPVPAGIQYWGRDSGGGHPPEHCGVVLLQAAVPSTLHQPVAVAAPPTDAAVPAENFGLLGRPDAAGRPSWLSPLPAPPPQDNGNNGPPALTAPGAGTRETPAPARGARRKQGALAAPAVEAAAVRVPPAAPDGTLPYWIEAAIGLGVRFLRVAAAGEPAGSSVLAAHGGAGACCCECGRAHLPVVDEYYFWLAPSAYYDTPAPQVADLTNANGESQWEDPTAFPALLAWDPDPMVHLHWCRVHDGEFGELCRSEEGVALDPGKLSAPPGPPTLALRGRLGDSLVFGVDGAVLMPSFEGGPPAGGGSGFAWAPPYAGWPVEAGWRYDVATDEAVLLPLLATPPLPVLQPATLPGPQLFGGLTAYPFFVYFEPGASLEPLSPFAPLVAVAGSLGCHCRFGEAMAWYQRYFNPLSSDDTWTGPAPVPAVARQRAVLLDVLELLVAWADALMAPHLECDQPAGNAGEAFAQARVVLATAARILGDAPRIVHIEPPGGSPPTVSGFSPADPPLNPRLVTAYDRVRDRAGLLHECENRPRRRYARERTGGSFWGDDALTGREDACATCGSCEPCDCCDAGPWCAPPSPYRFDWLLQKSLDLTQAVRGLGAALLTAFEKGDAEYLAGLRASQDHQLQGLTLAIRKDQFRDADWQVQALKQARLSAQNQLAYYTLLVQNGLNTNEVLYQDLTGVAMGLQIAAQVTELIAQVGGTIPDTYVGIVDFIRVPMTGGAFTNFFTALAKAAGYLAQDAQSGAGLALTEGGWDRRLAEWQHQIDIYTIEIERLTREILGAERRSDAALREVTNQQRQIENTKEIDAFLRHKFSNVALYLYHQRQLAGLYRELYELAVATARQAERAFRIERGQVAGRFVGGELWGRLHEGLLAGERLEVDLRRMEKAYRDCNRREYELTKHISLQRDFPLAFLQLRITGRCEFELPEWLFDLDYPGQYLRRIRSLSLTIPCVTGPYTGVHCRLTQLAATTRTQPWLHGTVHGCCGPEERCTCCEPEQRCTCCEPEQRCTCGDPGDDEGRDAKRYRPLPGDPRIHRSFTATEAIATSTGMNDSGLFELNFRDERYLPFEFSGAVSRWRLELPPETNRFDPDTVTDVILHLNYTSREGGEALREAAWAAGCCRLPGDGLRLFDVAHDFPDGWATLRRPEHEGDRRHLRLRFEPAMFPYVPERRVRWINRLLLVFSAPDAEPGRHHLVRFWREGDDADDVRDVECIASEGRPGYFYGAVDLSRHHRLGPLEEGRPACCTFALGEGPHGEPLEICTAFVVAGYDAECWPRCGTGGHHRCGRCGRCGEEREAERRRDDR